MRGYALIAALIVLVVASLAATVAVQRAQTDARREREAELLFVGDQYRDAIWHYHAIPPPGGQAEYPRRLEDLVADSRFPSTVRHLRRLYPDPMTGKADWELVLAAGRIVGVHSRSTEMPLRHVGFTLADAGFDAAKSYQDWVFSTQASAVGTANANGSGTDVNPPPSPPPPHLDQRIYCYNTFLVPQSHCTDEPPPTGNSVESCVAFYGGAYNQCIAAIPGQ